MGDVPRWLPSFDDFWMIYPRRTSRANAEKAWSKLCDSDKRRAMLALPTHIKWWASRKCEMQHIPHASTWLNQRRWTDELEFALPAPAPRRSVQYETHDAAPPASHEFARAVIEQIRRRLR